MRRFSTIVLYGCVLVALGWTTRPAAADPGHREHKTSITINAFGTIANEIVNLRLNTGGPGVCDEFVACANDLPNFVCETGNLNCIDFATPAALATEIALRINANCPDGYDATADGTNVSVTAPVDGVRCCMVGTGMPVVATVQTGVNLGEAPDLAPNCSVRNICDGDAAHDPAAAQGANGFRFAKVDTVLPGLKDWGLLAMTLLLFTSGMVFLTRQMRNGRLT